MKGEKISGQPHQKIATTVMSIVKSQLIGSKKSRRVEYKKNANDAKKCLFLNYPVRDRMLVDENSFVREERAVRYATFSRHILSLTGHFWNVIFKKQTSDFYTPPAGSQRPGRSVDNDCVTCISKVKKKLGRPLPQTTQFTIEL